MADPISLKENLPRYIFFSFFIIHVMLSVCVKIWFKQGRILGGALGARAPRGHQRGAKKKEKKGKGKKERGEKRGKRGKEGNKKEKREQKRKKKVKSIWREGCHAVSSASRGSREENVRGAKLTGKITRGAPCSFKWKQGLQGRKRQGRQIDGEKDERCARQFQVQTEALGKKT